MGGMLLLCRSMAYGPTLTHAGPRARSPLGRLFFMPPAYEITNCPTCPAPLPRSLRRHAGILARAWAESPDRPHPKPEVSRRWDRLIARWISDDSLPIFIRRAPLGRGRVFLHDSGRELVPTDNTIAHWAFQLALMDRCPSLAQIRRDLASDRIPVAMILKASERRIARYKCALGGRSINTLGWKVCHLRPVGLRSRGVPTAVSLSTLHTHFRDLLSPSNMFLVPKHWSGLGEMPEMLEAIRTHSLSAS